ncbi:MAG: mannosyltransferase family protein [Vicinamibacterales bacterium]
MRVARGFSPAWIRIAVAALAFRVLSACVGFLVNAVLPLAQREQFTVFSRTNHFWDAFARWDSGWFYGIARNGYAFVEGGRSNLAFFPAYPLSMRYVGRLLGGDQQSDYFIAGILVSWTAFVLAMIVLYRLAQLELGDEAAAIRVTVYAAVFPFAFFLGVVYSESLFLLGSVTTFYAMRRSAWLLAGLAGALTTATRANGIFMLPALLVLLWPLRRDRPALLKGLGAVALASAGYLAYSLFVYQLSGSFFEWRNSIVRWDWSPGSRLPWMPVWTVVYRTLSDPYGYLTSSPRAICDLLNSSAAIAFVAATPFIVRRFGVIGVAYAALIVINLFVPMSSGSVEGLGRYAAVLFPFPLWLASLRGEAVHRWLVATFGMFYVVCFTLWVKLYPLF